MWQTIRHSTCLHLLREVPVTYLLEPTRGLDAGPARTPQPQAISMVLISACSRVSLRRAQLCPSARTHLQRPHSGLGLSAPCHAASVFFATKVNAARRMGPTSAGVAACTLRKRANAHMCIFAGVRHPARYPSRFISRALAAL